MNTFYLTEYLFMLSLFLKVFFHLTVCTIASWQIIFSMCWKYRAIFLSSTVYCGEFAVSLTASSFFLVFMSDCFLKGNLFWLFFFLFLRFSLFSVFWNFAMMYVNVCRYFYSLAWDLMDFLNLWLSFWSSSENAQLLCFSILSLPRSFLPPSGISLLTLSCVPLNL